MENCVQKGVMSLWDLAWVAKGSWFLVILGVQWVDPLGTHFTCLPQPPSLFTTRLHEVPMGVFLHFFHCLKTCLSRKESRHCLSFIIPPLSDDGACVLVPKDRVGFHVDSQRRPLVPDVGAATAALLLPATGAATAALTVRLRAVKTALVPHTKWFPVEDEHLPDIHRRTVVLCIAVLGCLLSRLYKSDSPTDSSVHFRINLHFHFLCRHVEDAT